MGQADLLREVGSQSGSESERWAMNWRWIFGACGCLFFAALAVGQAPTVEPPLVYANPDVTFDDPVEVRFGHRHRAANDPIRIAFTVHSLDRRNFGGSEFCIGTTLTNLMSAMPDFVAVIVAPCVPPKVAKSVVSPDSIIVAGIHSRWPIANESHQNELVNATIISLSISEQGHKEVSSAKLLPQFLPRTVKLVVRSVLSASPYLPGVRHGVTKPSGNMPEFHPVLDGQIGKRSLTLHGGSLLAAVKGPAGVSRTASGSAHFTQKPLVEQ